MQANKTTHVSDEVAHVHVYGAKHDITPHPREVQRLHQSIRTHKERLHGIEMKLRDIRKGKGRLVRL